MAKVKQLLASLLVLPRGQGPETIPISWNTRYSTNGFKHLISKARIRHPNFLKNCVLGPSGPKIKAKAVQETAGSSSRGAGCA